MLEHYESYSSLSAEAISSGVRTDGWEKPERFLMSLGDELESLKIQWAVLPEDRQVWTELVRIYNSLADRRGLEQDRETAAQVSFLTTDAPKGPKMDIPKSRKGKGKGGGGGGKGKGGGGKGSGDHVAHCDYCNFKGHSIGECRKKAAGEPSHADFKRFMEHTKQEKSWGSINNVDS